MKLSSLIEKYQVPVDSLVSYLREMGVKLNEPVNIKQQIPDKFKQGLDKKFGINYRSKSKESRYMIWRQELPSIHQEAIECILRAPNGKRTEEITKLLINVVDKITTYCIKHPDIKQDAQNLIIPLLSGINVQVEAFHDSQLQKKTKKKKSELLRIKNKYNQLLDTMEEDRILFDKDIEWDSIEFKEEYLLVKEDSGKEINLPYKESKEVYNLFRTAFNDRMPLIKIRIHSKKAIEIVKTPELEDIFKFLKIENEIRLGTFFKHNELYELLTRTKLNIDKAFLPKDKTPYIEFLVKEQCIDYRFVPMYETGQKELDSFLFTIQGNSSLFIVWESKRLGTATYVFPTDIQHYEEIRQAIYDYVCSNVEYKRRRVHHGVFDGMYGIKSYIINHNDLQQWKNELVQVIQES